MHTSGSLEFFAPGSSKGKSRRWMKDTANNNLRWAKTVAHSHSVDLVTKKNPNNMFHSHHFLSPSRDAVGGALVQYYQGLHGQDYWPVRKSLN